jgi:membrane protein DedA with SNARE-associated domain
VKKKVKKSAAWALAVASLMPPPFPFTPFVAAAAALQYPRQKLLTVIGISRFIRFSTVGLLAVFFGTRILELAKSPVVQGGILAIIALSVGASAVSIYGWVRRSRGSTGASARKDRAA